MQGTLLCTLMKREELRDSFLSLSGEQARVQTVTSLWVVLKQASGWAPTLHPGVVRKGSPENVAYPQLGLKAEQDFQVSEVVREWREASEGL